MEKTMETKLNIDDAIAAEVARARAAQRLENEQYIQCVMAHPEPVEGDLRWVTNWGNDVQREWARRKLDERDQVKRAEEQAKVAEQQAKEAEAARVTAERRAAAEAREAARTPEERRDWRSRGRDEETRSDEERKALFVAALQAAAADEEETRVILKERRWEDPSSYATAAEWVGWLRAARRAHLRATMLKRGVPELHMRHIFDVEPKPTNAMNVTREWLASSKAFLFLSGGVGTGKSAAAAWVCVEGRGIFVTADELSAAFGFEDSAKKMMERLKSVELLVIDDLGTEYQDKGGYFIQNLNALLNHRYGAAVLRTVVTTNIAPEDFVAKYERLADRVREAGFFEVIGGKSMRASL
jgi:DNA replication protein DnaC